MHMHFHDFFLSFSRYRNNFIFHKYVREKMHSKLECFVRKDFIPLCLLTQIIAAILHKKLAFETRSNLTLHFSQAQCTHTMGRDQFCRGILISIQPSFQCQYLAHRIQQPIPKLRIQMFTNFTICFYFFVKSSFIG